MNRLSFIAPLSLRFSRSSFCGSSYNSCRHVRVVRAEPTPRKRFFPFVPTSSATTEEVDPGVIPGTNLRILKYPHPLLRAQNAEFRKDELAEAKALSKTMLKIMYASNGIGLAAPQIGINRRMLVFNVTGDPKKWTHEIVLVNPKIVSKSKATDVQGEACLSFPNMGGPVQRNLTIKIEAQRLNGKVFRTKFEGWKARVFQHEYDHLDGILYIDRIAENNREDEMKKSLVELIEQYKEDPYEGRPAAL